MKKYLSLAAGLVFAASSSMAFAQAAAPQAVDAPKMADCSKEESPDKKAYCEAKNAAMDSCKDKKGDEMKACVKDAMMKKEAK